MCAIWWPPPSSMLFVGDEAVGLGEVVELGAGVGVGDGDLDGLAVERLGEVDGVADGFLGLAGQAEDEVGVDDEAEVVAVAWRSRGRARRWRPS